MTIFARCACGEPVRFDECGAPPESLHCDACDRESPRAQTLCIVCDSPDPWKRRDTLHFVCTTCGNSQTRWAPPAERTYGT